MDALRRRLQHLSLNESPSEKEGKYKPPLLPRALPPPPSMKVPPKRKGNTYPYIYYHYYQISLNESPSEKEGKYYSPCLVRGLRNWPSMKVPPKRKGNLAP